MKYTKKQQEVIDDILYYRTMEKENRIAFYEMELYDDLALCEIKARSIGINIDNIGR